MKSVVLLLAVVAVAAAVFAPADNQALLSVGAGDSPAIVKKPDPPTPDADGIVVEQVVNVHKTAIVIVTSPPTAEGARRRALIRETWMQPLNRTSEFALPVDQRRQFSVWFAINHPSDLHTLSEINDEGKKHGDVLLVSPKEMATDFHRFVSLVRWMRVAYFQRFSFLLFTLDDSFVSLYNLANFCNEHSNDQFFYGGFSNSFELAPKEYHHKYYAPFIEQRTIVISHDVAEVLSRELPNVKSQASADITLGSFLLPFELGKPRHFTQFIPNIKNTYSDVKDVIVGGQIPDNLMRVLSRPILVNGRWMTPTLPAQTTEFSSRGVFIDPHPKDNEPACDGIDAARCTAAAFRAVQDVKH